MSNHTHLVVVPESEAALSHTMRDTHGVYASMFNRKHGLSGHLWQSRYYSCTLDDQHLWHAVRYVERNPVRAGMAARAQDYPWSSALAHAERIKDRYLDDGLPLLEMIADWTAWLAETDNEDVMWKIRESTMTGRACGSDDFARRLEDMCGHALRRQKRGRKPALTPVPK
jgi:putative transposase